MQWESSEGNFASKLSCSLALPLWEMNLYSEKLGLGETLGRYPTHFPTPNWS